MTSILLRGRVFSVERRESRDRSGRSHVRDVVVHPGAVVIVPVPDADHLVLIRNHRASVEETLLELPAGTLEPGEAPHDCAARELEEETGYRAERIEPLCRFYTSPGICTEQMWAFEAWGLTPTEQRLDDGEEIDVVVMEAATVRGMLLDGKIEDGKTIAALGTYFLRQDAKTR